IKEKDRLFIGEEVPKEYLTDPYIEKIPDVYAVALPIRHEEVVELVKFAKEKQLTIIARGAGTGVAGAQVPIHGQELIIDVKLMNRILGLDEETFTLTVEPGVLVGEIHQYVESRLFLPTRSSLQTFLNWWKRCDQCRRNSGSKVWCYARLCARNDSCFTKWRRNDF